MYVLTLMFSNVLIQPVKPTSSTPPFKEAYEPCVNEPLETALPFDFHDNPRYLNHMLKPFKLEPQTPLHQHVADPLVLYLNT